MATRQGYAVGALFVLLVVTVGIWSATGTATPLVPDGECPAVSNSLYFTIVYGLVTVNEVAAPVGTVVETRNPRGNVVGCAVVTQAGSYGALYVYGEDTSVTPPVPGMRAGEIIAFYVDGQPAAATPALAWSNDHQVHAVALDVGGITVTPTLTATVAPPGECPTLSNTLYFTLVYGAVSLNDTPAPVGTAVEARSPRGDTVGCFIVTEAGSYGTLYVYGEDTSVTPPVPGMREGEGVTFYINGNLAFANPSLIWQADQAIHQINLQSPSDTPAPTPAPPTPPTYTCPAVKNTLRMTIVYGTVTLNGIPAPVGTVVEARNSQGVTAGCFVVTQVGSYGTFYIYGEDSTVTPPLPGMQPAETIIFYVNRNPAIAAPESAWENDRAFHQVDLNASETGNILSLIFLPLVMRQ